MKAFGYKNGGLAGLLCAAVTLCPAVMDARPSARDAEDVRKDWLFMEGCEGKVETQALARAPHGGDRKGHQLDVAWKGGTRSFNDLPPYDEELEGTRWAYCGYDSRFNLHLISKGVDSVFTGALMDDSTGRLIPGGLAVFFSPDRSLYLAFEQPDGLDGEAFKLYTAKGRLVGEGVNLVLEADQATVRVGDEDITDIRWGGKNQLLATMHVKGSAPQTYVLTTTHPGKIEWVPR